MTHFKIFLPLISIFFHAYVLGADLVLLDTKVDSKNGSNDQETRKNIAQQCLAYRVIFNRIYEHVKHNNPAVSLDELVSKMVVVYDSGFLAIFKEGFNIAKKYMSDRRGKEGKKNAQALIKLAMKAQEHDAQKTLTAMIFVELNIELAEIVSRYKGEPPVLDREKYATKHEVPIFIIYAHPDARIKNRGPAKKRFVDEYVGDGLYPSWLALLDVHSTVREVGTKQDPHFSIENGVLRMLLHDLDHVRAIKQDSDFKIWPSIKAGHQILQHVRAQSPSNEAKILEDGLFTLFHESNVFLYMKNTYDNDVHRLTAAAEQLANSDKGRPLPSARFFEGMKKYKEEERDKESLLKNRDKQGYRFLETLAIGDDKERALPIAYDAKATIRYRVIEKPEQFLSGMSWVLNLKDVPEDIRRERANKYADLTKAAFKNYWHRFIEIIQENSHKGS